MYLTTRLTEDEKRVLLKRLLLVIAYARLPFSIVERPSFLDLVRTHRCAAVDQIPTRRALAGPLLAAAAASSQTRMLGQAKAQL